MVGEVPEQAGHLTRPTAVITGASKGIGRAIALRLALDYAIVGAARSKRELDTLGAEIAEVGGEFRPVVVDLRNNTAVAKAFSGIDADVLINNAGVGTIKPLLELTPDEWHTMVDVNLNALFHVTRAVLPGMIARKHGHVIIIGSISGRSAFVGGTCYTATKHAVMGFSESLLFEVRDHGVKVTVVNPGSVATGFGRRTSDPSGALAAEDVAEAVSYALSTPPNVLAHRIEVRALKVKKKN